MKKMMLLAVSCMLFTASPAMSAEETAAKGQLPPMGVVKRLFCQSKWWDQSDSKHQLTAIVVNNETLINIALRYCERVDETNRLQCQPSSISKKQSKADMDYSPNTYKNYNRFFLGLGEASYDDEAYLDILLPKNILELQKFTGILVIKYNSYGGGEYNKMFCIVK